MSLSTTISGPYVTIEVSGVLTMADLDPLFGALDTARRAGPFVVLTDTTEMVDAPMAVIYAFAERLRSMPALRGTWLGDAVVIGSPGVRFVVSTLLMIAPLPTAMKAFEERVQAERWCADILQRMDLPIPPSLPMPVYPRSRPHPPAN